MLKRKAKFLLGAKSSRTQLTIKEPCMARIDEDAYSKFQLIYCWGVRHGNRAAGNTSTLMNLSQTSCSTTGNPVFSYLSCESSTGKRASWRTANRGARPLPLPPFVVLSKTRLLVNIELILHLVCIMQPPANA